MSDAKKADAFDLAAGVPGIEGALRPQPKFADRISKRVIFVVFAVLLVVLAIFFAALDAMDQRQSSNPAKDEAASKKKTTKKDFDAGVPKELTGSLDGDGAKGQSPASLVKASAIESPVATDPVDIKGNGGKPADKASEKGKSLSGKGSSVPALGGVTTGGAGIPAETEGGNGQAAVVQQTPEQKAADQAKQNRLMRMEKARTGGLSARSYGVEDKSESPPPASSAMLSSLLAAAKDPAASGFQPVGLQAPPKGDSEQDEKLDFIKNAGKDDRGYHQHIPIPAISPNEIKKGSYIPLSLEQGVNSTLPGQVTARVTEDVYDTITGCRLLIPAMTKAVGRYDSKIAVGQDRNLVAWNGMVFGDGSELNLGGMQGYDTSGAAGMESDVDNHYLRLFGLTFGMSMVTAGVQMSVPQPSNGTTAPTSGQAVATALAQQYGNLGAQILGKYMAVQPTLRNFPGERFTIMVPSTIVFKKVWRNRCNAGG